MQQVFDSAGFGSDAGRVRHEHQFLPTGPEAIPIGEYYCFMRGGSPFPRLAGR
jgi:hypothetical protein